MKPAYQCCGPPVPDTSSQVDFVQVLIYQPADMLGWCIAVQLLLGHTRLESTVRYLGIEVDDALNMAEQIEL